MKSTKKACDVKEEELRSQQGRSVKSTRKGYEVNTEGVYSQQGVKPTRNGCVIKKGRSVK